MADDKGFCKLVQQLKTIVLHTHTRHTLAVTAAAIILALLLECGLCLIIKFHLLHVDTDLAALSSAPCSPSDGQMGSLYRLQGLTAMPVNVELSC